MNTNPLISVILPCFNGSKYLSSALESILSQTYGKFELLISDDNSTDDTAEIIKYYALKDERIKFFLYKKNLGLGKRLNQLMLSAKGKYIIRMDQDDICIKVRFAKQVKYMENNQAIGLCGSWVELIGDIEHKVWKYPDNPELIKCRLLFFNTLAHPSVIMRKSMFLRHKLLYSNSLPLTQDYDLWTRAAKHFPISNICKVLLKYRINSANVKNIFGNASMKTEIKTIHSRLLEDLGIEATEENLSINFCIGNSKIDRIENLTKVHELLSLIKNKNDTLNIYSHQTLGDVIFSLWKDLLTQSISKFNASLKFIFSFKLSQGNCALILYLVKLKIIKILIICKRFIFNDKKD